MEQDAHRLTQVDTIVFFKRQIPITELVTLYFSERCPTHSHGIYCSLVPSFQVTDRLNNTSWDFSHGHGYPGANIHYENEMDVATYCRFGDNSGVEPLIIDREFYGIRPDYLEICEEFRFFHKLYHDQKEGTYIKIDDAGNECIVAILKPNKIKIRLKELRQFIAIKEMHLSIQFDYKEFSQFSLKELNLESGGANHIDDLLCWGLHFGDGNGLCRYNSFSRLLGKRFIPPLPKEKSGMWGFEKEEKKDFVDFIIGINDDGEEIVQTSDPDELGDNFGGNPDAPHYLTPVHFRKEVLDKYFQLSSKFSVEDSYLRCGALWGMQMDNHHSDKVCAWLGDLGRDLPYEEQLHWRSYNIHGDGSVSNTYFQRQILSQFTDSDRPEHNFVTKYSNLIEKCNKILGWPLLLPLAKEDLHHMQSIRLPSTNEQKDFDDLILALTKIMVDSLNEKELNRFIPKNEVAQIKGSISRLERVLSIFSVNDYSEHIAFIRNLQNLRSSSAAHRKGKNYQKIAKTFEIENKSLINVFEGILIKSNKFLEFLEENLDAINVEEQNKN